MSKRTVLLSGVMALLLSAANAYADYVARGFKYFALDSVDVTATNNFVAPVVYTFASKDLYCPLETSNTFGAKGEIELSIISHRTLCAPVYIQTMRYKGAFKSCKAFTWGGCQGSVPFETLKECRNTCGSTTEK